MERVNPAVTQWLESLVHPGSLPDAGAMRVALVWIFVTAHVLADFLLQGERTLLGRQRGEAWAYAAHGGAHLLALAALSWPAWSAGLGLAWVAVVASHVAVDLVKDSLRRRQDDGANEPDSVLAFLVDQALHLWIITAVMRAMAVDWMRPWEAGSAIVRTVTGIDPGAYFSPAAWKSVAVYAFVVLGGAMLVRMVLEVSRIGPPVAGFAPSPSRGLPRTGTIIGMLERALILSFLVFEAHAAVGFVVAAKSIARFRELEDRAFAEYYLVGTLLSVLVAMAGYLALRA